jgi:hypothetical protein
MFALACGVCSTSAFAGPLHAYREAATVCVRVQMIDYLSGSALRTLQAEATRIWIRHGIDLSWKQSIPAACPTVVSIIFDERELWKLAGGSIDTALARTVFLGRSQTIYVSAPRAFAMLSQLHLTTNNVLANGSERDLGGGTLLGRVVAHELGHVLLTTLAHSDKGLMRPVFGLRDVLSTDEETMSLSPAQTTRLAMRFSLVPLDAPSARPSVLARSEMSR